MPIEINRLSARRVQTMTEPGRHADGGGLYLVVDPSGAKRWTFLYSFSGKRREMGFGPLLSVSLADARERADEARRLIAQGIDPLSSRETTRPKSETTFCEVAEQYMTDRAPTWRNAAHRRQWRQTLETQCADLWKKPVATITTDDVMAALRPLWHEKPETARRIRGRIERIIDAARAMGKYDGENPARWRGHLELILPRPAKLVRGHQPALPYAQVPAFFGTLKERGATAASMLQLLILTAARPGEIRGMDFSEIDADNALWTIPAARMKAGLEHRVPLSAPALALIEAQRASRSHVAGLVFPGPRARAYSDSVFLALLRRMSASGITAHGFRSSFRDWAADETDHPREVIEAALAHRVGDETERAYRRGDALAKRRRLMDDWASYCTGA